VNDYNCGLDNARQDSDEAMHSAFLIVPFVLTQGHRRADAAPPGPASVLLAFPRLERLQPGFERQHHREPAALTTVLSTVISHHAPRGSVA